MAKTSNKKDNPMTMISLRLPEDMVTELKRIAPLVDESGYQPLIRTYIERGLAMDLTKLENPATIDYQEDSTKAEAEQEKRIVAETRAEYIVDRPPEFIVGSPVEWNVAVNEESEENWGKNLANLLDSFTETGWEDVDDSVEWVANSRKERREAREKLL